MRFVSEIHYASTASERARLTANFVVDLQKGYKGYHEFASLEEGVFASLDDDILTLFKGFVWDLCSPSVYVRGRWVGTPTGSREAAGSCIHDAARRIYRLYCTPFDWKDTNDFFWDALALSGSHVKRTYYFAVSSFLGKAFSCFTE